MRFEERLGTLARTNCRWDPDPGDEQEGCSCIPTLVVSFLRATRFWLTVAVDDVSSSSMVIYGLLSRRKEREPMCSLANDRSNQRKGMVQSVLWRHPHAVPFIPAVEGCVPDHGRRRVSLASVVIALSFYCTDDDNRVGCFGRTQSTHASKLECGGLPLRLPSKHFLPHAVVTYIQAVESMDYP